MLRSCHEHFESNPSSFCQRRISRFTSLVRIQSQHQKEALCIFGGQNCRAVLLHSAHFTNNVRQKKGRSKRPNTFTMTISGPKGNEIAVLLFGNMVPVDKSLIDLCVINNEILKDEWIFIRKNLDAIVEKALKVYRSRVEGKNQFAELWCCDFKKNGNNSFRMATTHSRNPSCQNRSKRNRIRKTRSKIIQNSKRND